MSTEELNCREAELYTFLSFILRIPDDEVKKVYSTFDENGLAYVAMFNMYSRITQRRVFFVNEFHNIVPESGRDEIISFVNWCHKNKTFLKRAWGMVYSPSSNTFSGYAQTPSQAERDLLIETVALVENDVVFDIEKVKLKLRDLTYGFFKIVVPSTKERLCFKYKTFLGVNIVYSHSILSMYLRHSTNMLGMITDLKIIARVLKVPINKLLSMMNYFGMMKIDKKNKIFYDSFLLKSSGMGGVPSRFEIVQTKELFNFRVLFMEDIIKLYFNKI